MPTTRLPADYGVDIELADLLADHYAADAATKLRVTLEAHAAGFTHTQHGDRVMLHHDDEAAAETFVLRLGYSLDDVAPACDHGHRVYRPTCPACN